jgi:2-phospho-L-lactate guanylyltransferase (CobY/MobA/RfbA family)
MGVMTRIAVVVPLKSFATGKGRLRTVPDLDVDALSKELAVGVITAALPRDVFVVTDSDDVVTVVSPLGAQILRPLIPGLNEAVHFAFEALRSSYDYLVIAHGDLRDPAGLGSFEPTPGVTIVQDHVGQGTTVLAVPTTSDFTFHYGPESCHRHAHEARLRGLAVRIDTTSPWRFDIDEPEDLQ